MREVLHYVGYDGDVGGIISVVRALAETELFHCVLGVNRGFRQRRSPPLPTCEFYPVAGDTIGWRTLWRARRVAREVRAWLGADEARVFHGHSPAGLLVALWLARAGQPRVLATVHCFGRQRWFYRWAEGRLGRRLFWLSPAMKRHYGVGDVSWTQCIPDCVPALGEAGPVSVSRERSPGVTCFGAIGALVPVKRWELILDALALLPPALRERMTVRHIGGENGTTASRDYAAGLRARTRSLHLENTMEWLGEQPSSAGFLGTIDCLILASHEEAFSVAMLEALQRGVPVLAPDCGGATDMLTAGVNGWFFQHARASDLARALTTLVEGEGLATVRVGPDQIQPFTAPVVARQWADVYARASSGQ